MQISFNNLTIYKYNKKYGTKFLLHKKKMFALYIVSSTIISSCDKLCNDKYI